MISSFTQYFEQKSVTANYKVANRYAFCAVSRFTHLKARTDLELEALCLVAFLLV